MPKLYIIAGCNGSGKTTASYTMLPGMFGHVEFVNSDEFAKSLSPFDPGAASVGASRYMLLKVKYMMSHGKDFCIETTLATRSLIKIIRDARSHGYYITMLYFWLSTPELAIRRVRDRVLAGGHDIPEDVIRRRYVMGLQYFFDDYCAVCDKWILADNTEIPFTIVAEGTQEGTTILDSVKYQHIWEQAHPTETEVDI